MNTTESSSTPTNRIFIIAGASSIAVGNIAKFISRGKLRWNIAASLLVLAVCGRASASGEHNGRGTRPIGMANAFTAIANDAWAIHYNSAGLAQIRSVELAGFIVPQQFGLPELQTRSMVAAVPLENFTLGVHADQFGFDLYKETHAGVAIGLNLAAEVDGGVRFGVLKTSIERYGVETDLVSDAGFLVHLTEALKIGSTIKNFTGSRMGHHNERLPQAFTFGVSYAPNSDFVLSAEVEKDVRFPESVRTGVEKILLDVVALRVGVGTNPELFSAGLSVLYRSVTFGYAGYSHADLGWTHQVEIAFVLSEETK